MASDFFWNKIDSYNKWVDLHYPNKQQKNFLSPPLYRLFWKLNLRVLPAPYQSGWRFVVIVGLSFSIFWHIFFLATMTLVIDPTLGRSMLASPYTLLMTFLLAAFSFGVLVLLLHNRAFNKMSIPSWSDL